MFLKSLSRTLQFEGEEPQTRAKYQRLLCLLIFSSLVFFLGLFAEEVNTLFAFQREKLESGQLWRAITCNLVHLSSNHMFMNLCVYVLTTLIFAAGVSIAAWYGVLAFSSLCVGGGLYFFDSGVSTYVGLSGAIYGMLAFGLLVNLRNHGLTYFVAYLFVIYRVLSQQTASYDPVEMADFIGGNVIASAHLIGLVAGNLSAVVWFVSRYGVRVKS